MKLRDYNAKKIPLSGDAQRLLVDLPYEVVSELIKVRDLCERFPRYGGHSKSELIKALEDIGMPHSTFCRRRKVYEEHGTLSSLHVKPKVANRGPRLPKEVDEILESELKRCLANGTRSPKRIWEDVAGACYDAGLKSPAPVTVQRRLNRISDREIANLALGKRKAEKYLGSRSGMTPKQTIPLARVQIDHTLVNLVGVNRINGLPVGCPWITMAIDEASRAVLGLMLGYEVPSTASLAKFMNHMVHPKDDLLRQLNIDFPWPMQGKPMSIYTDRGSDFTAHAFKMGCLEHNIDLEFRPAGKTHFGGIIERLIGTTMGRVKLLKGTTDGEWKEYKRAMEVSAEATYTIEELERQLLLWVTGIYNITERPDLNYKTPLQVWCENMGGMHPPIPKNKDAFFLDFLARGYRRLHKGYIQAMSLTYWDDALESLLRLNTAKRYEIRFDIHDVSRIWLRNPKSGKFIKLRARRRDMGPTSLAEWRASRRQAKAMNLDPRNEDHRMRALAELRRHRLSIPKNQRERVAARQESRTHRAMLNSERHGLGYQQLDKPRSSPQNIVPRKDNTDKIDLPEEPDVISFE